MSNETPARSADLIAHVLHEARLLVGESPEQVGGSVRVAGRTIRRLEEATSARPRDITLTTLAAYYGLDGDFLRWLVRRTLAGADLTAELRRRAETRDLQPVDDPRALALMLARLRPVRPTREESEVEALRAEIALLNDRRRRLVRQFVDELRLAQSEEVRRREHVA